MLDDDLEGRVQPFDTSADRTAGSVAARQRRDGRPVEIRDVLIAGIATARKATQAPGTPDTSRALG